MKDFSAARLFTNVMLCYAPAKHRVETYGGFGTTVDGVTRMSMDADSAGSDNDLTSWGGVLAHEMDSELYAVDDRGIENVNDFGIGDWWYPVPNVK
jgi:hypothetical protein